MSFVSELRRRNVVRVAIAYGVVSWLVLQLTDVLAAMLDLPDWTGKLVIFLLGLGLPFALVMSWVYEITPDGLARTSAVDPERSIASQTGRRLDRMTIAAVALAVGVLLLNRYVPRDRPEPQVASHPTVPTPDSVAPARSIAVLPFVNMSNDPANEYFSDGMSEEILNTLAGIDGLQVAARTSSFRFKGQSVDVAEIGRQLKVGAVLEGSVRRQGDSVRITAQLIEVTNGYHLWSRTFDRTLDDVFAVQTEIASQILVALQPALSSSGSKSVASRVRKLPSENPRAYELFLQGRHLWRQRNAPALERAVAILQEAVKLDPQFAEAYAALANAYYVMQNYASVDVSSTYTRARQAAERAQELDGSLAEPLAVLSAMLGDERQWSAAERGLRRAMELDPDQATPRHWLALQYLYTGRLHKFSSEIRRAYALDPTNAGIVALTGVSYQLEGDLPQAIRYFELSASMGGIFALVTRLPAAYYDAGQPERGLEAARRGYTKIGLDPALAETIHAAVLDPAKAGEARRAILAARRQNYSPHQRITDLVRIGDYEVAVAEALNAPDAVPADVLLGAWFKSSAALRRAPAFRSFVRDVGLLSYWKESGWPDLCRPHGDDFECD